MMTENHASMVFPGKFIIVDEMGKRSPDDVLYSFAWDELACRKAGAGLLPPLARIWRHPRALVLGLRDRRLPNAAWAMERLRGQGVSVAVRNSGGAAVPLDSGIVNLSLIFPHTGAIGTDFHREFRLMAEVIGEAAGEWGVRLTAGEIHGAYCPGEYDLAAEGRKFCGIAQRRQLRGVVVSAFVLAEGAGADRERKARVFYSEAAGDKAHSDVPELKAGAMASLQELAGVPSAEAFAMVLRQGLERRGGYMDEGGGADLPQEEILSVMEELRRRYDSTP